MIFLGFAYSIGCGLPSCAESHGLQNVDECARVSYEAPKERSGVCFGGFRPMKHVEEPRLRAEANFGAQARLRAETWCHKGP